MTPIMIWLVSVFAIVVFFFYLLKKIIENYENMIEREKYEQYKNERYKT